MPIIFVKEHGVDRFRGKRRVGASRRLSPGPDLHSGLTGSERLAGRGSQLAVPFTPGDNRARHQAAGCAEGRRGQRSC